MRSDDYAALCFDCPSLLLGPGVPFPVGTVDLLTIRTRGRTLIGFIQLAYRILPAVAHFV